ncbi:MAG TPA: protein kinase [Cyanobacteria bacterium UBA11149]|nr:protein kinase [Cyanobacteria bacterium UBA11367]HBE56389.1 protein kinase [Cyanobacteria bacterium UBA11366]HBK63165.1 protein kinase [Cyanobacteria bacterium UBA11166]HBR76358.1 protein kinase [Cyanobacteria bacterium UBA11159]HBS71554.1 protein kinase [Cyanobacteria bacterium UBA11153]HBW88823.1 protein kinase [Cyanobacteria bacterium UBA11149]
MNPIPNYKIEQQLGHNKSGGRVTYLATQTQNQNPVVIKQFQFAKTGTTWSDFDAHQREISLLQNLNSPNIPKYLDAIETPDGFCLIQEYKPAPSLAIPQPFTPQEIKEIAIAVLEVLVYLQQQIPPIIHRDIKPENILVEHSPQIKIYLVDFGLARSLDSEMAASTVVKGTLGFMPPEQIFNRKLTEASDLYSLGATLICLLTNTKSTDIGNLMDESYRLHFKPLISGLNPQFISWLEKMVAPNLKYRYPNAATALKALLSIEIVGNGFNFGKSIDWKSATSQFMLTKLVLVGMVTVSFLIAQRASNTVREINSGDYVGYLRWLRPPLAPHGHCPKCDLRGTDLRGLDLRFVDLTDADLRGADLRGTDLQNARLQNANLNNANLNEANLREADLYGADLRSSYLESTNLAHANLTDADLRGAYLQNANLFGVDLRETNLESADTTGAILPDNLP